MELEFKPVVAGDIDRLRPFYGLRPNKTCDSVFLDSFLWKDYYHVQCAVSEGRAVLWLMEKDGESPVKTYRDSKRIIENMRPQTIAQYHIKQWLDDNFIMGCARLEYTGKDTAKVMDTVGGVMYVEYKNGEVRECQK